MASAKKDVQMCRTAEARTGGMAGGREAALLVALTQSLSSQQKVAMEERGSRQSLSQSTVPLAAVWKVAWSGPACAGRGKSEEGVVRHRLIQDGAQSQAWRRRGGGKNEFNRQDELERMGLGDQLLGDEVGRDGDGVQLLIGVGEKAIQSRDTGRSNWS